MSNIRVNQLCKQFNVAPEELVAFLQAQGIIIDPVPNAKVPDSYIPALQKKFGTDDKLEDGAKVVSHSKEPIAHAPRQGKTLLITDLCNRCEVPLENLAQAVGQPQWLIDSTMQGKITNDVTVAAIVGRLLQIYRKKLDCELKDAEKGTLVSREQLKQWEAGQKIDFDKVEGYLDKLAKYAKIKKEKPAPSGKVLSKPQTEPKSINNSDAGIEKAEEFLSDSLCQRYGKLISLMFPYIISLGGTKIATVLGKMGYDKKKIDKIKNGTSKEIRQYREIAVRCMKAIAYGCDINSRSWGRPEGMSWKHFKLIVEDDTGLSATIDEYEMLWSYFKNYHGSKRDTGRVDLTNKTNKKATRKKHHSNTEISSGGVMLTPEEQSVRHQSYSSYSGGFDYGITDT